MLLLLTGVVSVFALSACSHQSGSLTGHVIIRGPVASTRPNFTTTVQIRSQKDGKLVAGEKVRPRSEYTFTVAPGNYTLTVLGIQNCSKSVVVRSSQTTMFDITCVPAPAA